MNRRRAWFVATALVACSFVAAYMSGDGPLRWAALSGAGGLAWIGLTLLSMSYWRQRRPRTRLFHYTSPAAAAGIVVRAHADGTADACFIARRAWYEWLLPSRRPCRPRVYFFTRRPGRFGRWLNLRRDRSVCLEVLRLEPGAGRVWRRYPGRAAAIDGDVRALVRQVPATGSRTGGPGIERTAATTGVARSGSCCSYCWDRGHPVDQGP